MQQLDPETLYSKRVSLQSSYVPHLYLIYTCNSWILKPSTVSVYVCSLHMCPTLQPLLVHGHPPLLRATKGAGQKTKWLMVLSRPLLELLYGTLNSENNAQIRFDTYLKCPAIKSFILLRTETYHSSQLTQCPCSTSTI